MPDTLADTVTRHLAHRLPRRLLYWSTIEAHSKATTGYWSTTECPADAGTILRQLADGTTIGKGRPPASWTLSRAVARLLPAGVRFAAHSRTVAARRGDEIVCGVCDGSGILLDRCPADVLAIPEDGDRFDESTDAARWAEAFVSMWGPGKAPDHATMIGWFANAIERGRDAGRAAGPVL